MTPPPEPTPIQKRHPMAHTEPTLILVVDDSARDRELLARILEREGHTPILAPDGHQALALALQHKPDLVLLDVFMPGMDGLEVCRKLKADPATEGVPVIFLTGRSQSLDILTGFQAGAVDYVTKPFQIPELLARVQVHLELRRAHREIRSLRGILPTCAHCKRIRDGSGTWHDIETYISRHSEAMFSHGICPECIPVFFPDQAGPKGG
jgi:DNA-binding response OmpR family regulator